MKATDKLRVEGARQPAFKQRKIIKRAWQINC